jgi:capsular polysaccharide biosynthesis protein
MRFGYEPVFLEELNFADSVKVMMEAESVIGPHGAGWANALFCHPGTTGIMWTWRDSLSDNWFSNIASVSEMKFTTLVTNDSPTGNHNLSPERLRRSLESLHISPS